MRNIVVFTDGASKGNPGPGGWGAIIADDAQVIELGGAEAATTNNRMELTAALEAIEHAASFSPATITVYADSSYVVLGATRWGAGWRRNGWVTSTKQPVLNRDLWERLLEAIDASAARIEWRTIGGHVGIGGNERVDEIASSFALGAPVPLYGGARDGYDVDLRSLAADESQSARKTDARSRSKSKAYSYVSEVDGIVEVHATWPECEARVRGKRARFKKALDAQEEQEIVRSFSR